jgi:hypothetical protein
MACIGGNDEHHIIIRSMSCGFIIPTHVDGHDGVEGAVYEALTNTQRKKTDW